MRTTSAGLLRAAKLAVSTFGTLLAVWSAQVQGNSSPLSPECFSARTAGFRADNRLRALDAEAQRIDQLQQREGIVAGQEPGPCKGDDESVQAWRSLTQARFDLYNDLFGTMRDSLTKSRNALQDEITNDLETARRSCPEEAGGLERVQQRLQQASFYAPPVAPPADLSSWAGTYTDPDRTVTLQASGNGLTGDDKWTSPGESFAKHGATSHWTNCVAQGTQVSCDSTGEYHDPDKSITNSAKLTLQLDGDQLTVTANVTDASASWHVAPYASAVHKGAVFVEHVWRH